MLYQPLEIPGGQQFLTPLKPLVPLWVNQAV